MKGCVEKRVIGPSFKRIVLTSLLLACLAAPVILYRDLRRHAVERPNPEGSDAQANPVNAERLLSLRCESMQE